MGRRGAVVGEVQFDGCRMVANQLLGERCAGMGIIRSMFNFERVILAGAADGLVSRVVAPEGLQRSARELAAQIAAHPPQALRWTKRLRREDLHLELPAMFQISGAFQAMAHHTCDHQEALDALFERRPPTYQGR